MTSSSTPDLSASIAAVPTAASPASSPAVTPAAPPYLERGTAEFRRAALALLLAGYATFSLLYCAQPLLPAFSTAFGVSPAESALSVSLATGMLALAIFVAGFVSESWSRRRLMTGSLVLSSLLTLGAAFVPDWGQLLLVRALVGVALGGVPAVAIAYLAEEVHPRSLGFAVGLYVGGTAIGGMSGRVISGVLSDYFSWRVAFGGIGALGLLATLAFYAWLPPSRHFVPRRGIAFGQRIQMLRGHLQDRGLLCLYGMGFALMGSFVTVYNYLGYRLIGEPFSLSHTAIGAIFVVYLVGVPASPWAGRIADAFGRGPVLMGTLGLMLFGAILSASSSLAAVVIGITLFTLGFFAGHAVASGWVGVLAKHAKGQAAALYLLAYYLGSSLVGSYGGHFWAADGWSGVVGLVAVLLLFGLAGAEWLRRREQGGLSRIKSLP
jgi:YNFM family putative membrane transporter